MRQIDATLIKAARANLSWSQLVKVASHLKQAKFQRVRKLKYTLVKLARAETMRKQAELPQYPTIPHSSLTATSDYATNKRYGPPERNEYTLDEQRLIERLRQGMSPSRRRIVDAHRRGRTAPSRALAVAGAADPKQSLQQLFASSGLWG